MHTAYTVGVQVRMGANSQIASMCDAQIQEISFLGMYMLCSCFEQRDTHIFIRKDKNSRTGGPNERAFFSPSPLA